ncbi:hypothetical protein M231_04675 [Tremella mesenterica]|uniref:Uncharacterized protein n=1 Tax=Tremella mesenterica TaxID=5217 RepID=A0A4Q1BK08_TREME|nr:hypothetical protein M231_04675 [Tremella mesenterica]
MTTSPIFHPQDLFSSPEPPQLTHRPTSDPIHRPPASGQQIYVLSADGSSLFLLDPTKPANNEEPPPYAPFSAPSPPSSDESSPISPEIRREVPFPSIETTALLFPESHGRHRARTMSAVGDRQRAVSASHRSGTVSERPRPRYHSSFSNPSGEGSASVEVSGGNWNPASSSDGQNGANETTPLLPPDPGDETDTRQKVRGLWGSVWLGELGDVEGIGFKAGWRRFWAPMGRGMYWRAVGHLVFLNFPFALFVWPFLVAGTLAGTALLITLPIGAAVWWLTLFISRSAARLEMIMQLHHHSPLDETSPTPTYHPIFYRIKERSTPASPVSPRAPTSPRDVGSEDPMEVVWEEGFMKCSYAMFSDHYSYSALTYFLLIKPLITLFSTIIILAMLPISFALIFLIPVYLRAMRRWGRWQASVAVENL